MSNLTDGYSAMNDIKNFNNSYVKNADTPNVLSWLGKANSAAWNNNSWNTPMNQVLGFTIDNYRTEDPSRPSDNRIKREMTAVDNKIEENDFLKTLNAEDSANKLAYRKASEDMENMKKRDANEDYVNAYLDSYLSKGSLTNDMEIPFEEKEPQSEFTFDKVDPKLSAFEKAYLPLQGAAERAVDSIGKGLAAAYEKRPTDTYSLYSGLRSALQENPNAAYARSLAKSYGMAADQGSAKRDFADMQHANMIEQKKLQSDKEMLDKILNSRDDQTSYLKEVVKALNNYKSR